ncbi:MAG TPA: GNAT family N-acetyltransferase [Xanthobacteraceae bacterium]|jgi:predicted N-acyltransferase|nr:GNAT family N-acetyltransferase [Xanthobacteraceae bacterium]
MNEAASNIERAQSFSPESVVVVTRDQLKSLPCWDKSFASERKDHRYYELIEDTLHPEFEYRYFAITDADGHVCAIQPFFILHQDMLEGVDPRIKAWVSAVRRFWPRFMQIRTLMVGCVAGEGHLDGESDAARDRNASIFAANIVASARKLKTPLIVLKEFPSQYRNSLKAFLDYGFARLPSFPMTKLNIDYKDFDDYAWNALTSVIRQRLRKKFQAAEKSSPITMTVAHDITSMIEEIYPLYFSVYERSNFHFEKLTKEYFCEIGRRMPDKVRFFIWRQNDRVVAFSFCMVEGDAIYTEYIGLDYKVAIDLHLYHYMIRDTINWAIANGYKWFRSSGLNYEPKRGLRALLDPLDLYVQHTSPIANRILKRFLPWLEPTRYDKVLPRFPNYGELWVKD